MPRGNPRPWFRPSRNTWYATIDGVQHNLRTADKQTAYDLWHELMAKGEPPPSGGGMLVVELLALFADHSERNAKATTYNWYRHHLESFAKTIPRTLEVGDLKPFHVTRWLDRHSKWKTTTKHGAVSALKRALQWAVQEGYIDRSPVGAIRKAPRERRETILTNEQRQLVLDEASDQEFRDYLTLLMETGARPQELRIVAARHVDLGNGVWILSRAEHKTGSKTDRPRVVYLTPKALEITRRLMQRHPQGPLLRNSKGESWTKDSTHCRFQRLRKRLKAKLPADLCSYSFRHTYATDALQRGVDPITVAELMGHRDATMVARVYQHLGQRAEHMRSAAQRATQSESAS